MSIIPDSFRCKVYPGNFKATFIHCLCTIIQSIFTFLSIWTIVCILVDSTKNAGVPTFMVVLLLSFALYLKKRKEHWCENIIRKKHISESSRFEQNSAQESYTRTTNAPSSPSTKNFCGQCGAPVDSNMKFCTNCGAAL